MNSVPNTGNETFQKLGPLNVVRTQHLEFDTELLLYMLFFSERIEKQQKSLPSRFSRLPTSPSSSFDTMIVTALPSACWRGAAAPPAARLACNSDCCICSNISEFEQSLVKGKDVFGQFSQHTAYAGILIRLHGLCPPSTHRIYS